MIVSILILYAYKGKDIYYCAYIAIGMDVWNDNIILLILLFAYSPCWLVLPIPYSKPLLTDL